MEGGKGRVRWVRVKGRGMNDMERGFSKKLFFSFQLGPIHIKNDLVVYYSCFKVQAAHTMTHNTMA